MKVRFAGVLVRFVDYQKQVEVEAPTVRAALDELMQRYPKLKRVLLTDTGDVRSTHKVFVNGKQVSGSDLNAEVGAGDQVEIVTAIAGG